MYPDELEKLAEEIVQKTAAGYPIEAAQFLLGELWNSSSEATALILEQLEELLIRMSSGEADTENLSNLILLTGMIKVIKSAVRLGARIIEAAARTSYSEIAKKL